MKGPAYGVNPVAKRWTRFWMRHAGLHRFGRLAARLAAWGAPPYKQQVALSNLNPRGFVAPTAQIWHPRLELGANVYVGDRVTIFGWPDSGPVRLGNRVRLLSDIVIETGHGGELHIGEHAYIHPLCQINAYREQISIGCGVLIAASCSLYVHNHGTAPDRPIREQPLETRGPIVIGDDAWLGAGVTVLGGARIGRGAVIGAGAVVTGDIPDYGIAVGIPARVIRSRLDSEPAGREMKG